MPNDPIEHCSGPPPIRRQKVLASLHRHVETAVDWLHQLAETQGVGEELMNRLLVAVSEAVTNSLRHGNQYDPVKDVILEVLFYKDHIEVIVEDEGMGFEPAALADPLQEENLIKEGGRGVYLIEQLADQVQFEDKGRRVCMLFEYIR